jgi:hypothetical protein
MLTPETLLMVAALILFLVAAWPKNLIGWGLFCVTLAQLWPLVR